MATTPIANRSERARHFRRYRTSTKSWSEFFAAVCSPSRHLGVWVAFPDCVQHASHAALIERGGVLTRYSTSARSPTDGRRVAIVVAAQRIVRTPVRRVLRTPFQTECKFYRAFTSESSVRRAGSVLSDVQRVEIPFEYVITKRPCI